MLMAMHLLLPACQGANLTGRLGQNMIVMIVHLEGLQNVTLPS